MNMDKCPQCGSLEGTPCDLDCMFNFDSHIKLIAHHMRKKLRANTHKGGWQNDTPEALIVRLREEVDELEELIREGRPGVYGEAADVANFAMMIADVVSVQQLAEALDNTSSH